MLQLAAHLSPPLLLSQAAICGRRECFACGAGGARQCCSACIVALYCNRECQLANWRAHKHRCKLLRLRVVPGPLMESAVWSQAAAGSALAEHRAAEVAGDAATDESEVSVVTADCCTGKLMSADALGVVRAAVEAALAFERAQLARLPDEGPLLRRLNGACVSELQGLEPAEAARQLLFAPPEL